MTIPKELGHILTADSDYLSGAVRFVGTRVPVQALFDTLDEGDGMDEFLEAYPGVSKYQAELVIHWLLNRSRPVFGLELAG